MRRWSEEGQTSNKKIPALPRDFFCYACDALRCTIPFQPAGMGF
jgi:hypothetical protein